MTTGQLNLNCGKTKLKLDIPFGENKVLLHSCCAPCSSAIVECLLDNGVTPTIFYCNPNIYPQEEYLIRKNECTRFAQSLGLEIVDDDYDHEAWLSNLCETGADLAGLAAEPERGGRCLLCFKYRLLRSAEYALAHGFRVLTTTLASSRWKSLEQINEAGNWAVAKAIAASKSAHSSSLAPLSDAHSACQLAAVSSDLAESDVPLLWWEQNWRKGGLQERRNQLIKEYSFYNQTWCGCEFSK